MTSFTGYSCLLHDSLPGKVRSLDPAQLGNVPMDGKENRKERGGNGRGWKGKEGKGGEGKGRRQEERKTKTDFSCSCQ